MTISCGYGRLIREGVLRKLWGHGGSLSNFVEMNSKKQKGLSAEEYTFFLFNDLLLFVRPKVATTSGLVAQKGQHPKNSYRYVNSFSWDSRVNVGHAFEVADIPESDGALYAAKKADVASVEVSSSRRNKEVADRSL